jgi:glutamate N-acetyltransferase/amino-acid N-acetyltransferase
VSKGIAEVPGILCGTASCGLKGEGKPDILLVVTQKPAVFSAVFTENDIKSAPVKYSKGVRGRINGIVANSGNANACTGRQGLDDAKTMAELAGKLTGRGQPFLVASTGVIGEPLPMERVKAGIALAVKNLGRARGAEPATAIMTTDTFPKTAFVECSGYVIGGIAKGAGMIDPSMATMLCFVATDARISRSFLAESLKESVEESFNRITVDGDMSTNDCVFAISTGASTVSIDEKNHGEFTENLKLLLNQLAYQIVRDGEGATKVLKVVVRGARSPKQAKAVARKVALSPLVKTAVFGGDPNWGRVAAVAGSAKTGIDEERLEISIGDFLLFSGKPVPYSRKHIESYMKTAREIAITLNLNLGSAEWEYLTCDLTYEYVRINAEYTT